MYVLKESIPDPGLTDVFTILDPEGEPFTVPPIERRVSFLTCDSTVSTNSSLVNLFRQDQNICLQGTKKFLPDTKLPTLGTLIVFPVPAFVGVLTTNSYAVKILCAAGLVDDLCPLGDVFPGDGDGVGGVC